MSQQQQPALGKAYNKLDLSGNDLPPSPAPSTPSGTKRYSLATELVYTEHSDQYNASSMPLYQTATFKQTSGSGGNEYDYTRSGNPTRSHLEKHLAKVMRANRALAVSSGMGAMDVISRMLRPGDEVVAGDDLYGGTNRLLKYLSTHGGIIVHHVDTTSLECVTPVLSEKTAMVLLETPTNPLIKIVDLPAIARAAHTANPKTVVAVDNTMLSPWLQNPLELGADRLRVRNEVPLRPPRPDGGCAGSERSGARQQAVLHHQRFGVRVGAFRLLAAAPWHKNARSEDGEAAGQRHGHCLFPGITGFCRSIPRIEESSAVRSTLEHGAGGGRGPELYHR